MTKIKADAPFHTAQDTARLLGVSQSRARQLIARVRRRATKLALDDNLVEKARRAGKHKTKHEAVMAALVEYVKRRKQVSLLQAFGTFDFDPAYNYKAKRRRR